MRKIYLLITLTTLFITARSQETKPDTEGNKPVKFSAGLSYSYMSLEVQLAKLSLHSVWRDVDLGTHHATQNEIDEINSFVERSHKVNNVNAEFGMSLINNDHSKWRLGGKILLGLARSYTKVLNTASETNEVVFESKLNQPCFGLGFNVAYYFNRHWGISVKPAFISTFGKTSDITDLINLVPDNYTQTGADKFSTFYERISLLASFTAGPVTFMAGPGFYWLQSNHNYRIERTNNTTGEVLIDETRSLARNKSFVDGSVEIDWRIIKTFRIWAFGAIGNDLLVNTGISYGF